SFVNFVLLERQRQEEGTAARGGGRGRRLPCSAAPPGAALCPPGALATGEGTAAGGGGRGQVSGRENKSAIRLVPLRGMVYLPSHVEGATRRRTRSGGKPTVKVHRRFGFARVEGPPTRSRASA